MITNKKENNNEYPEGTGNLVIEKYFDIQQTVGAEEEQEPTTDITVNKIWNDNDNADGNRPESITVHLLAGGAEVATAQLTAESGWSHTFRNLPKFRNGHPITYNVTEDPVPWYTTTVNGHTIINTYQPETTAVGVRKIWDDDNNATGQRPTSIVMTLSNGMHVVLSADNNWTAMITDLPTRVNGAPVTYTWTEQYVLGYDQTNVGQNGMMTSFTNSLWQRPENPSQGKPPKLPGNTLYVFDDYETPLGIEIIINHVGDCFD